MVVPLDQDARRVGDLLLVLLILYLTSKSLLRVEVHYDGNVLVVLTLESELFWDHMLLGEVKCTHGPYWIALKELCRLCITLFQSSTDVSFKEIEHFKESSAHSLQVFSGVFLVLLTQLLDSLVGAKLDFLSRVDGLLLTNRPIEVNICLLELAHGSIDMLHQAL